MSKGMWMSKGMRMSKGVWMRQGSVKESRNVDSNGM